MIFHLKECPSYNEDCDMVLKILKHLSNGVVNNHNLFKMKRVGMAVDGKTCPVLVVFREPSVKLVIMKNLYKVKTLDGDTNKIVVHHDLTPSQKAELDKLWEDAKRKQEGGNKDFLFVVRGEIGKW